MGSGLDGYVGYGNRPSAAMLLQQRAVALARVGRVSDRGRTPSLADHALEGAGNEQPSDNASRIRFSLRHDALRSDCYRRLFCP
jgi:hypothetical protein